MRLTSRRYLEGDAGSSPPIGVLKDWRAPGGNVELRKAQRWPGCSRSWRGPVRELLRGIAVSVNAEFRTSAQALSEGDEVGLLPRFGGSEGWNRLSSLYRAYPGRSMDQGRQARRGWRGGGLRRHRAQPLRAGAETPLLDYEAYDKLATGR